MPIHLTLNEQEAQKLGLATPGLPMKRGRSKPPSHAPSAEHKLFDAACRAHGLPVADHEYRFAEPRRWKFDHLFDGWLAVEVSGSVWARKGSKKCPFCHQLPRGHHSGGQGQIDDMEKLNEAQIMGYVVLQVTPQQIESGEAFALIRRALGSLEEQP